jgi:hypothetical protein
MASAVEFNIVPLKAVRVKLSSSIFAKSMGEDSKVGLDGPSLELQNVLTKGWNMLGRHVRQSQIFRNNESDKLFACLGSAWKLAHICL